MADLPWRNRIESRFARDISKVAAEHKHELFTLMGYPPDINNVPDSFWQKLEDENKDRMFWWWSTIFTISAMNYGIDRIEAARKGSSLAEKYASDGAQTMALGAKNLLTSYLGEASASGEIESMTKTDVRDLVSKSLSLNRIERETVNQVTQASHFGGEWAAQELGMDDDGDIWMVQTDPAGDPDVKVCPVCIGLYRMSRREWSKFVPLGPPVHHFCRCWIKHIRLQNAA